MRHISTIRLTLEPLGGGAYLARSPDVPGLNAEGKILEATVELAKLLIRDLVTFWRDEGIGLPAALADAVEDRPVDLLIPVELDDGR